MSQTNEEEIMKKMNSKKIRNRRLSPWKRNEENGTQSVCVSAHIEANGTTTQQNSKLNLCIIHKDFALHVSLRAHGSRSAHLARLCHFIFKHFVCSTLPFYFSRFSISILYLISKIENEKSYMWLKKRVVTTHHDIQQKQSRRQQKMKKEKRNWFIDFF